MHFLILPNSIASKLYSVEHVDFFKQKNISYSHHIVSFLFNVFLFEISLFFLQNQKFQQNRWKEIQHSLEETLERKKTFDFVRTENIFFESQRKQKSPCYLFAKRNKRRSSESFPLSERKIDHNLYPIKYFVPFLNQAVTSTSPKLYFFSQTVTSTT